MRSHENCSCAERRPGTDPARPGAGRERALAAGLGQRSGPCGSRVAGGEEGEGACQGSVLQEVEGAWAKA